jgi:polysaccharide deacetylase 2 family uncharacterized protein YibQ
MAQGIWSGIGLGAVFSVSVAGIVSVLVPMEPQPAPEFGVAETIARPVQADPQPSVAVTDEPDAPSVLPQVSLRAPADEELPNEPSPAATAPRIGSEIASTAQEATVDRAPVDPPQPEVTALVPPPAPTLPPVEATAPDTNPVIPDPLPQPQTGNAGDLTQPRPLPGEPTARAGEDDAVLPNPQALAPMIPDDSADAEIISEAPAPMPDPETQENEAPLTVGEVAPRTRVLPVPDTQAAPLDPDARPSIGRPARTLISPDSDEGSAVETVTQTTGGPAADTPLRRFAQPFDNAEGKPLMSIVLMDTGADLDADEIGLPALSSFPYPVSFAVDASLPDAATRMARYRAEGFDVLAIVDLPQGAQPTDAEVSLSVALDTLDEVIGVLEGTGEGLQTSREVADQVTGILKASGHGLVAQSKGLNSMPNLANKEGVPAAAVFRDFDSEGQDARVIRRFLDQAAFKAGQEGGVIMLGRLRPQTIEALLVWGLADRAGAVALAPVSAVLLAQ